MNPEKFKCEICKQDVYDCPSYIVRLKCCTACYNKERDKRKYKKLYSIFGDKEEL